jgi:hypothetical protein
MLRFACFYLDAKSHQVGDNKQTNMISLAHIYLDAQSHQVVGGKHRDSKTSGR